MPQEMWVSGKMPQSFPVERKELRSRPITAQVAKPGTTIHIPIPRTHAGWFDRDSWKLTFDVTIHNTAANFPASTANNGYTGAYLIGGGPSIIRRLMLESNQNVLEDFQNYNEIQYHIGSNNFTREWIENEGSREYGVGNPYHAQHTSLSAKPTAADTMSYPREAEDFMCHFGADGTKRNFTVPVNFLFANTRNRYLPGYLMSGDLVLKLVLDEADDIITGPTYPLGDPVVPTKVSGFDYEVSNIQLIYEEVVPTSDVNRAVADHLAPMGTIPLISTGWLSSKNSELPAFQTTSELAIRLRPISAKSIYCTGVPPGTPFKKFAAANPYLTANTCFLLNSAPVPQHTLDPSLQPAYVSTLLEQSWNMWHDRSKGSLIKSRNWLQTAGAAAHGYFSPVRTDLDFDFVAPRFYLGLNLESMSGVYQDGSARMQGVSLASIPAYVRCSVGGALIASTTLFVFIHADVIVSLDMATGLLMSQV
jgi:hypothetical protein